MNNFQINTNFNTQSFNNSINDFNKSFSTSINETNKDLNSTQNFQDVFNAVGSNFEPMKAGAEITIGENNTKETSPVAKMAQDIQNGFHNGINELSGIEKKSEADIETFASGGDISIHEVMISAQKSQLAMQMAVQLRNQMLNAYNEFKNMSV